MKHVLIVRYLLPLLALILHSCSHHTSQKESTTLSIARTSAPQSYASLLSKYVTPQGVRYQNWAQTPSDLEKLEQVTQFYANHQPPSEEKEALAWHLNAYNSWVLQRILADWPNQGPLNSNLLFFHKKAISISGQKLSLLHFENKVIRKKFSEPRIHFALNCASRSCPPLHHQPFRAQDLDQTLQQLTTEFLNQNSYALEETQNKIKLSQIFDWYAPDFGGRENLIPFINQYREQPLPKHKKIQFLPYNWKINSNSPST